MEPKFKVGDVVIKPPFPEIGSGTITSVKNGKCDVRWHDDNKVFEGYYFSELELDISHINEQKLRKLLNE